MSSGMCEYKSKEGNCVYSFSKCKSDHTRCFIRNLDIREYERLVMKEEACEEETVHRMQETEEGTTRQGGRSTRSFLSHWVSRRAVQNSQREEARTGGRS